MPSGSVVISLFRSWFLSRVSPRFRLAGDVCESLSSVDLAKAPASVPWIFSVVAWSPFCRSPLLYLLFLFLWLLWRESPSSHMGTQPYEVTRPCDLSHLVSRAKPLLWVGGGEGKGPPLSCSQRLELGVALEMARPPGRCVFTGSRGAGPLPVPTATWNGGSVNLSKGQEGQAGSESAQASRALSVLTKI